MYLYRNAASELSFDLEDAIEGKPYDRVPVVGVSPVAKFIVAGTLYSRLRTSGSGCGTPVRPGRIDNARGFSQTGENGQANPDWQGSGDSSSVGADRVGDPHRGERR